MLKLRTELLRRPFELSRRPAFRVGNSVRSSEVQSMIRALNCFNPLIVLVEQFGSLVSSSRFATLMHTHRTSGRECHQLAHISSQPEKFMAGIWFSDRQIAA